MNKIMAYPKQVAWLILVSAFWAGDAAAKEAAEYTVVMKQRDFEVREYVPHVLAETFIDEESDEVGTAAFGRLSEYVAGHNTSGQTIKMKGPITQDVENRGMAVASPAKRRTVRLMLPLSHSLETLPQPNDPEVVLRVVSARHMAAISYSGGWNEKGFRRNKDGLNAWLQEKGLNATGEAVWARYNAPYMPWFLRRNAVLMPIEFTP